MTTSNMRIVSDASAKPLARRVALTKRIIDSTRPVRGKEVRIYDTLLPGLHWRVRPGAAGKFIYSKRVNGRLRRVTIGGRNLTVEEARKVAKSLAWQAAQGVDPAEAKRQRRVASVTLQELWDQFKEDRQDTRKPATIRLYEGFLHRAFAGWLSRPVGEINQNDVLTLHRKLGKDSGHAYANLAMRILSSLIGYARKRGYVTANPVDVLRREWFRVKPRKGHITDDQLAAWFSALDQLRQNTDDPAAGVGADYLEVVLLTGLRRNEAAGLTWDRVDLDKRTLTISETKNSDPLVLPLSNRLMEILATRKTDAGLGRYVFPSPGRRAAGQLPLHDPRFATLAVAELTGINATIHDLRRTFISVAVRLVPYGVLKQLVNHRAVKKGDVTLDYVALGTDELRPHVETIAEFFLSKKS